MQHPIPASRHDDYNRIRTRNGELREIKTNFCAKPPNAIGEVAVDIADGAAQDADSNGNMAARLSLGIPYDDDGNGAISRNEVITAIGDYFDEIIAREQVIAVITLYLSG